MKKPIKPTTLGLIGLLVFAVYLSGLYMRSGRGGVRLAIITALVILFIQGILYGYYRAHRNVRRARRRTNREMNLAATGRTSPDKKRKV